MYLRQLAAGQRSVMTMSRLLRLGFRRFGFAQYQGRKTEAGRSSHWAEFGRLSRLFRRQCFSIVTPKLFNPLAFRTLIFMFNPPVAKNTPITSYRWSCLGGIAILVLGCCGVPTLLCQFVETHNVSTSSFVPGMTKAEVVQQFGEPNNIYDDDDGTSTWVYYRDCMGISLRVVNFDTEGRVKNAFNP